MSDEASHEMTKRIIGGLTLTDAAKSTTSYTLNAFLISLLATLYPLPSTAQNFSSHDIIQGLARPGGIEAPLSGGLSPRPGGLAPLKLTGADATVASDQERGSLRKILAAYVPPSIEIEILFRFGSAEIDPAAYPGLAAVAQALVSPEMSNSRILIAGHTDSVGGAEYNLDLSLQRAAAVRAHLVTRLGITKERLIITGFGFERLKDFLEPESPVNRRVEFVNATGIFE